MRRDSMVINNYGEYNKSLDSSPKSESPEESDESDSDDILDEDI